MNYETLSLSKGKDRALERKHPWIFSGAFKQIPSQLKDGELVKVVDHKKNFKALGFFHSGRIAVKVLSFVDGDSVEDLLKAKIAKAFKYRQEVGILNLDETNCYRLVFGESDQLPGLIIDQYDHTAVVQIHHAGWIPFLTLIAESIKGENGIKNVYLKAKEKLKLSENTSEYILGEWEETEVKEHGLNFKIDWAKGQKTGFFIDQRESRKRLGELSKGKTVLNTFSYSGGFSIYALKGGAKNAVSVDISQSAIDLANENAELNTVQKKHLGVVGDVFEYLKSEGENFDIIVLDPPAFSKNKRSLHNAVQAYKRLNLLAFNKIKSGGLVFTFSCSQNVNPKLFEDTMRAAALESGRNITVLEKLGQPIDHPINLNYPEGEYLKGLILRVE